MKCYPMPISELKVKFKNGQINLDPPYQRRPAWKEKQRVLLLSSLFNGIPIPALIFHKNFNFRKRKDIYDVLDGKQRIETILHFIELIEIEGQDNPLKVEFINPHTNKKDKLLYRELSLKKVRQDYENILVKFWRYELPIIEYEGELRDFFDRSVANKEVFVRINSTGSPLKNHEIKHAKCSGLFFTLGNELEKKYTKLFLDRWKIVSKTDIDRYLLHEFILELCTAIYYKTYTDRRKKLDVLLSQHKWKKREINNTKKLFNKVVVWIKEVFPKDSLRYTRFNNKSDFYSLFVVLLSFLDKGYVTTDKKNNKIIGNFLIDFSKQIQKLDPQLKPYKGFKGLASQRKFMPYLISTRQSTDSSGNRELRHKFLMSLLKDGFILKSKDSKRNFDSNVRSLLWLELIQKKAKPKCPRPTGNKKCKIYLTDKDAQVDHRYPWSKGGRTKYENARLLCSSCNKSKGDRI